MQIQWELGVQVPMISLDMQPSHSSGNSYQVQMGKTPLPSTGCRFRLIAGLHVSLTLDEDRLLPHRQEFLKPLQSLILCNRNIPNERFILPTALRDEMHCSLPLPSPNSVF